MRFDQYVKLLPGSLELFSARHAVPLKRIWSDGPTLKASVPRLPRGPYTVRWHAMSGDGHVVSGVFTFGVRAIAPLPTEAFGASGPTRSENVVRWLYFLALALLVGGLGFRLLVLRRRPLTPSAEKRFYVIVGAGAIATLNVGIAAFILRAEDALQLPFGRLFYGDLSPIARSRFGDGVHRDDARLRARRRVALPCVADRPRGPAVAGVPGRPGVCIRTLAVGPLRRRRRCSSWKSELADWAHLSAACLWIGGLIQLVVVVWPLMHVI